MLTPETDKWGLMRPVSERSEIRSEIEELDADLEGWAIELEELKQRISEAKARRRALVAKYRAK
jgi:hypothetical protein